MSKRSITFFSFWILLLSLFHLAPTEDASWNTLLLNKNLLANKKEIEYNHNAFSKESSTQSQDSQNSESSSSRGVDDETLAGELDKLHILHPGPDSAQNNGDVGSPRSLNHCKALIYLALQSFPVEISQQLENLTLHFSQEGRRGMGGGHTIILRCPLFDTIENNESEKLKKEKELVSVFDHELGHTVDTGYFQGRADAGESEFQDGDQPIYKDDLSLQFYRLSFLNEKKLKPESVALDFVSGYAMSDPFEDFAESFNFYLLHGKEFRKIMSTSVVLKGKYDFLKTWVFLGKEFENGGDAYSEQVVLTQRYYDATILPYDIDEFFALGLKKRDFVAQKDTLL